MSWLLRDPTAPRSLGLFRGAGGSPARAALGQSPLTFPKEPGSKTRLKGTKGHSRETMSQKTCLTYVLMPLEGYSLLDWAQAQGLSDSDRNLPVSILPNKAQEEPQNEPLNGGGLGSCHFHLGSRGGSTGSTC